MKKKKNIVSVSDAVIVFVCLSGIFVSCFLFWKDWNISFAKLNEKPIAFIYFKHNTAQRRLINRNLWEQLRQASPLYDGDRIRTAEMSEAVTVFNDGNRIDLHENTLIQIYNKKTDNSITFVNGTISVLSSGKKDGFKVYTGSMALSFKPGTSAAISMPEEKAGKTVVAVTAGSVEISRNQKTEGRQHEKNASADKSIQPATDVQTVSKGDIYLFDMQADEIKGNKAAVSGNPPKVSAFGVPSVLSDTVLYSAVPAEVSVFIPGTSYTVTSMDRESMVVPFFLQSTISTRLQFSRESDFSLIIDDRLVSAQQKQLDVPLSFANEEDTLFWRMLPVADNQQQVSQVSNIACPSGVIFVIKPVQESIAAVAGAVLDAPAAEKINQSIQAVQEIMYKDTAPVENLPVAIPSTVSVEKTTVPVKKELKPAEKITEKIPEKPAIFFVVPSLLIPAKGKKFSDSDFVSDDPQITFKWKPVKDASSYTFTLYKGSGAGKKIFSVSVSETSYVLKGDNLTLLDNAAFTWGVQAVSRKTNNRGESKTAYSDFVVAIDTLGDVEIDTSNLLEKQ